MIQILFHIENDCYAIYSQTIFQYIYNNACTFCIMQQSTITNQWQGKRSMSFTAKYLCIAFKVCHEDQPDFIDT